MRIRLALGLLVLAPACGDDSATMDGAGSGDSGASTRGDTPDSSSGEGDDPAGTTESADGTTTDSGTTAGPGDSTGTGTGGSTAADAGGSTHAGSTAADTDGTGGTGGSTGETGETETGGSTGGGSDICPEWLDTPLQIRAAFELADPFTTICIGNGVHVFTEGLTLDTPEVLVQFQSPNAVLQYDNATDTTASRFIQVTADGSTFRGGTLLGRTDGYTRVGISLQSSDNHLIDDMSFFDFRLEGEGYGVEVWVQGAEDMSNIEVRESWFERCRHSVSTFASSTGYVDGLDVEDCSIIDMSDGGIDNHRGARNTIFDGNYVCMGDIDGFDWSPPNDNPGNFQERDGLIIQGESAEFSFNVLDMRGLGRHGAFFQSDAPGGGLSGTIEHNELYNVVSRAVWVTAADLESGAAVDVIIGEGNEVFASGVVPDEDLSAGRPGGAPDLPYTRFDPGQTVCGALFAPETAELPVVNLQYNNEDGDLLVNLLGEAGLIEAQLLD